MKNKIKYFFSLMAGAVLFTSCLPDPAEDRLVYNGPTLVEFKNHTFGMTNAVLDAKGILRSAGNTQTDSSRVINVNKRTTDTVFVQLIGPQRSTPTEINFELKTKSVYEGVPLAVQGTDFKILSGANKVTIPAFSSVGKIVIDPLEDNMAAGDHKAIGIKLLGNEAVGVSKNFSSFWIRLRK